MDDQAARRDAAISRLKAKRDFRNHVAVYVIVNIMIIAIWRFSSGGYFWPIWPIIGWGVGLALHGWSVYYQKPISEDDIRQEMEKDG